MSKKFGNLIGAIDEGTNNFNYQLFFYDSLIRLKVVDKLMKKNVFVTKINFRKKEI